MSELTDLRDWARSQARALEHRIDAGVRRIDRLVQADVDPDAITTERDQLRRMLVDRDLWLDQADTIDRWLGHRANFGIAATTDDIDPEAAFSDFLFHSATEPNTGARQ